jgi:hypothetical protein
MATNAGVRNDKRANAGFAIGRIGIPAIFGAALCGLPACSSSGEQQPSPHCVGTPAPCELTPQSSCDATPGCRASGTCDGFSTKGVCSLDTTFFLCINDSCNWTDTCVGVPLAQCNATTAQTCLGVSGCSWGTREPPSGAGGSGAVNGSGGFYGSGSTSGSGGYVVPPPPPPPPPTVDFQCGNNAQTCTSDTDCTCGLKCVTKCTGCQPVCGHACQTGDDCAVPGSDLFIAYCDKQASDQTGICH